MPGFRVRLSVRDSAVVTAPLSQHRSNRPIFHATGQRLADQDAAGSPNEEYRSNNCVKHRVCAHDPACIKRAEMVFQHDPSGLPNGKRRPPPSACMSGFQPLPGKSGDSSAVFALADHFRINRR